MSSGSIRRPAKEWPNCSFTSSWRHRPTHSIHDFLWTILVFSLPSVSAQLSIRPSTTIADPPQFVDESLPSGVSSPDVQHQARKPAHSLGVLLQVQHELLTRTPALGIGKTTISPP